MRLAVLLLLCLLPGLALCGWGLSQAHRQATLLQDGRPIAAVIDRVGVRRDVTGGAVPVVAYRYTYRGHEYTATYVTPLPRSGSVDWARGVAHAYAEGDAVSAFIDPAAPSRAYLTPRAGFMPYVRLMMGLVLLLAPWPLLHRAGTLDRPAAATLPSPTAWYELVPVWDRAQRGAVTVGGLIGLALVTGVMTLHYLHTARGLPTDPLVWIALPYAIATLIVFTRCVFRLRRAPECRVGLSLPTVRLDHAVILRVRQQHRTRDKVAEARAALVCDELTGVGRRLLYRTSKPLTVDPSPGGSYIDRQVTFEVPRKKRFGIGAGGRFEFPRVVWMIEVSVRFENGRTSVERFPLPVQNKAEASNTAPVAGLATA